VKSVPIFAILSIGGAACAISAPEVLISCASVESSRADDSFVAQSARDDSLSDARTLESETVRAPALHSETSSVDSATQEPKPAPKNPPQNPAPSGGSKTDPQAIARQLVESFEKQNIHLDLERQTCWIPVTIDIRDDYLEYLLVNPKGAAHESVFVTEVVPSALQTALLALGVERGKNAIWKERTPLPTPEEMHAGIAPWTVDPPEGDGLYMYAAWREKGETYFYRVEDLLRDLETGRSMRRHRWVYLGSRWVRTRKESKEESFMADLEGNLVNIALFEQGNTLLTAALPECLKQTIWLTNAWLVPQRGAEVVFIFTRERIHSLPPEIESRLPEVVEPTDPKADPHDGR
jgi:hypothetical protein